MRNNNITSTGVPGVLMRHLLTIAIILVALFSIAMSSCNSTSASAPQAAPPAPALPVVALKNSAATTFQEFSASLQGTKDIEIRPQVDGYLDRIYVDEGVYVRKGQPLFAINDRPYREQLNNAKAALTAAEANLTNAQINVSKLTPLVQNNVISDVQLKTSKSNEAAAIAAVNQAKAQVQSASISLGYTVIKAPVDGYVGRIPYKTGSLVGVSTPDALTVLSEVKEVYAYFSLSEKDFLAFENKYPGKTVQEKLKQLPPVELVLADNSVYPHKGRVETVTGQFNNAVGAISFRAAFPNDAGLLRSGNTGKIRWPQAFTDALLIPQEATFELQDKTFVFLLGDSNKVQSIPINVSGTTGNYYLVDKSLQPGQKIVYTGLDRLRDGVVIAPEEISYDSLLRRN